MKDDLERAKTACLLDDQGQCNPIWVSQLNGIQLAHFQTFGNKLTATKPATTDALFDKCVRHCLPGGGHL